MRRYLDAKEWNDDRATMLLKHLGIVDQAEQKQWLQILRNWRLDRVEEPGPIQKRKRKRDSSVPNNGATVDTDDDYWPKDAFHNVHKYVVNLEPHDVVLRGVSSFNIRRVRVNLAKGRPICIRSGYNGCPLTLDDVPGLSLPDSRGWSMEHFLRQHEAFNADVWTQTNAEVLEKNATWAEACYLFSSPSECLNLGEKVATHAVVPSPSRVSVPSAAYNARQSPIRYGSLEGTRLRVFWRVP